MASQVTGVPGAGQQRVNYLNLLIAQMKNQNPLEPLDNNQMAMQLAQLSQLDEMEQMNATFQNVLLATEMKYGASLISKEVSFVPANQTAEVRGRVEDVEQSDGDVLLRVGPYRVAVRDVLRIRE